jgi:hypothetical protein
VQETTQTGKYAQVWSAFVRRQVHAGRLPFVVAVMQRTRSLEIAVYSNNRKLSGKSEETGGILAKIKAQQCRLLL